MEMTSAAPRAGFELTSLSRVYSVFLCGTSRLLSASLAEIIRRKPDFQLVGMIEDLRQLPVTVDGDRYVVLTVEPPQHDQPPDSRDSASARAYPPRTVQMLLSDSHQSLGTALQRQAAGYVTLNDSIPEFLEVLRQVANGGRAISPSLRPHLLWDAASRKYALKHDGVFQSLSRRQIEVLSRIARGDSVKEVARDMHLSQKTIDSHKYRIMQKLGLHDRVQITRLAIREGLLHP